MAIRTSEDPCLLCEINKAGKSGSHITPASIIKKVVGERDKEEIYTITAVDHSISKFMGRSNLNNQDPEIKSGDHVMDHILCSTCEKKLGEIEGICCDKLNRLVDDLAGSRLKVNSTRTGNKYVLLTGVDKNTLNLYLYSIIWRQCLGQHLDNGTYILPANELEQLRQIVAGGISMSLNDIKTDQNYKDYPGLQVLTTYHKSDISVNLFNPNDQRTNPFLFFIGPYFVLLHRGPDVSPLLGKQTKLPTEIIDDELIIKRAKMTPVGIVNESIWTRVVKRLMNRQALIHNQKIYEELSRKAGISYYLARALVQKEAETFAAMYPNDSSACMNAALEKLVTHLN